MPQIKMRKHSAKQGAQVLKKSQPNPSTPQKPSRQGPKASTQASRKKSVEKPIKQPAKTPKPATTPPPAAATIAAPPPAQPTPEESKTPEVSFADMHLEPTLLQQIEKIGYKSPTLVQSLCLPFTLHGQDVAGFAQTGTGKTAVFLITAAHRILTGSIARGTPKSPGVLVLVPTRELADQIYNDSRQLFEALQIKSTALFGGTDLDKQARILENGCDFVVATPGRLLDLQKHQHIRLDTIGLFVCDEADRMFDMGFIEDVEYILRNLSKVTSVQKLLFSATTSDRVKELAFEHLEKPEYIETTPERIAPEKIAQWCYAVPAEQKFNLLLWLIQTQNPKCAVVFTNTKIVAEWVAYKLCCNNVQAEALTGDLPQKLRFAIVDRIKSGGLRILVATDVACRGLHVSSLTHVYNFDVPDEPQNFIHRIGRTARAGAEGTAVTLVCEDYGYNMGAVCTLMDMQIPVKALPPEISAIQDKSDFPFDETGRVKSFHKQQATAHTQAQTATQQQQPPTQKTVVKPTHQAPVVAAAPIAPQPQQPQRHTVQVPYAPKQRPIAATGPRTDSTTAAHPIGGGSTIPRSNMVNYAKETVEAARAAARLLAERKRLQQTNPQNPTAEQSRLFGKLRHGLGSVIDWIQKDIEDKIDEKLDSLIKILENLKSNKTRP